MVLRKLLQGIVLFLGLGSLNLASAAPMQEWEDTFEGGESEGPRGLVDEMPSVPDDGYSPDIVDVAVSPKLQNSVKIKRSGLAMVPFQPTSAREIKDETTTTGENSKKTLPSYMRKEANPSPYLHGISQVVPTLLPMDSHG